MKTPRMPHENYVKELLGLPRKLTNSGMSPILVNIAHDENDRERLIVFKVLTPVEADLRSQDDVGNKQPGRGRPRVMAQCDHCGVFVSAGRFNQHYKIHEQKELQ